MPIRPRTVAALAAAACLASVAVAPMASARTPRGRIALHTTSHRTVVAPSHVRPGLAELHNSGRHAVLVVSGPTHRAGELATDLEHSGPAAFTKRFAFRGTIAPHRSTYLRLSRGDVYLLDMTRPRVTASSIRTVHVSGSVRNASVPQAQALTVRSGSRMSGSRSVAAGSWLHVSNVSHSLKNIFFLRVGAHTSDAQLRAAAAHPTPSRMAHVDVVGFGYFGPLSPHRSEWTTADVTRGRYLVIAQSMPNKHTSTMAATTLTVR